MSTGWARQALISTRAVTLCLVLGALPSREAAAQSWLLIYAGGPTHALYTSARFEELLYPRGASGSHALFKGIVCLETHGRSGHPFNVWGASGPPPATDYFDYLDTLLAPHGALAAADSTVAAHSDTLEVSIMLPYPLGTRSGRPRWDSRLTFVAQYLQHAESLFVARRFQALRLWGFYWFAESVSEPDTSIVQHFSDLVHWHGLSTMWIPYYGAPLAPRWRRLGFDQAYLQPNYFVVVASTPARVDSALTDAAAWGMGLEVEFDRRLLSDQRFTDRLGPYLDALQSPSAASLAGVAVYDGGGALWELARNEEPALRVLYTRLVAILRAW